MGLGSRAEHGAGEHGVPIRCLGRHAPVAVVGHGARRRRAQADSRQPVHVVVCEGLFHVVRNVLSGGKVTKNQEYKTPSKTPSKK